jgi:glycosyltransferase involved in cell wall biosynthesis
METGKDNPKVILLAYYFPPQNTSGASRPARFFKYLPQNGVDVEVVAAGDLGLVDGRPGVRRPPGADAARFTGLMSGAARFFQNKFLPYIEHLVWVPHAVDAVSETMAHGGVDAIFSTSPPIATQIAALTLKKRFGFRWIADFRDPMVGNTARLDWRSRIYDPWLERSVFRHADVIIANTEPMAAVWKQRYPQWAGKIRVLCNGFDSDEVLPARQRQQGNLRSERVLAHVGLLYGSRHPGVLLASVERLIRAGALDAEVVRIRLIGGIESNLEFPLDVPPFTSLRDMGCLFCSSGQVSRAEAMQEMVDADSLLILDLHDGEVSVQVPAKLFEYVRSGLPILAFTAHGSATESILKSSGVRHVCVYGDDSTEAVDRKIQSFFALPCRPEKASEWFWENFDGASQTRVLSSLLCPNIRKGCEDVRPSAVGRNQ